MEHATDGMRDDLPTLDVLVEAADAGLHPWVRAHVSQGVRRSALAEELGFWLGTAAQDLAYAASFAAAAPYSGEPPAAYLDRWLPLGNGGHVLAGPRYLGLDPDLPFMGVSGCDRPLTPADAGPLTALARAHFAAFAPGFVLLSTADPVGAWPGTRPEQRQLVGLLGDLRLRSGPPELRAAPRADTAFYDRYRQIFDDDVARDPAHARHTRAETRDDLQELAAQGLVFDVEVDGTWAGIVAAEPDARRGVRGATVVELILDPSFRGRGYGKHLSTLLAAAVPLPDDQCLMGTIHADNVTSYRSALAAGRVDVGGEIVLPL
jgi:GNAT superfamily N-acetyltransferase